MAFYKISELLQGPSLSLEQELLLCTSTIQEGFGSVAPQECKEANQDGFLWQSCNKIIIVAAHHNDGVFKEV